MGAVHAVISLSKKKTKKKTKKKQYTTNVPKNREIENNRLREMRKKKNAAKPRLKLLNIRQANQMVNMFYLKNNFGGLKK